jgi:VanZ family protein
MTHPGFSIPRRSLTYGIASLCHLIFTLVFPFYSVPIVVWLMERNLYRLTISALAAPFFSFLAYFSLKRWPLIKKDRRLILILMAVVFLYILVYETVPDLGEKLHVLNFSILALLMYKAFSPLMKLHWALLLAWLLPSAVAGLDEYVQDFISGRAGTMHDVLIAVRSAILGGIIAWIFDAYSRKGRTD